MRTEIGSISFTNPVESKSEKPVLLVRPEAARLVSEESEISEYEIRVLGSLIDRRFQGAVCQVTFQLENGTIMVFHLPSQTVLPAANERMMLALNSSAMVLLKA